MIINGQTLVRVAPIKDMLAEKVRFNGVSHGLTERGYDIRIKQDTWFFPFHRFVLVSTIEEFDMPNWLGARVENKSTWARKGIDASGTTNIEPNWRGWLTLEVTYKRLIPLKIKAGSGIATIIFEQLYEKASYNGKYQDQPDRPVAAIFDKDQ